MIENDFGIGRPGTSSPFQVALGVQLPLRVITFIDGFERSGWGETRDAVENSLDTGAKGLWSSNVWKCWYIKCYIFFWRCWCYGLFLMFGRIASTEGHNSFCSSWLGGCLSRALRLARAARCPNLVSLPRLSIV